MSSTVILIIKILRILLGYFVKPVVNLAYTIYYRNIDKPMPLPRIKNSILLLPAHKLAAKIRNKEVRSLLLKFFFSKIYCKKYLHSSKVMTLWKHM